MSENMVTKTPESLLIKANAQAFGDGQHPTTRMLLGALNAWEDIAPQNAMLHMLDIGCGSGILGIFAAQKWGCKVISSDIEAQSVVITRENAKANQVSDHVTALQVDGFDHETIQQNSPYQLIVMNILADPLKRLAQPATHHLAKNGGVLMLSGMLAHEVDIIAEIYQSLGLELLHKLALSDWHSLILSK
jgi:ribosomal protein L11 methyltransferase